MADDGNAQVYSLKTDLNGVVVGAVHSNVAQAGMIEVDADLFSSSLPRLGRCKLIDGALQDVAGAGALPVVPEVISDRQCFQQLAVMGKISQDEALNAVMVGALPKTVSDGIAALPADQQFPARMLLCGATEFHRSHPMVLVFLLFFGLGEADRDPLWTAAALL